MSSCRYCHVELPPGTVRCPECGRMVKLSKKDKYDLLTTHEAAAPEDVARYLNSWQIAKERQLTASMHRREVFFRAQALAINSFIAAMIILTVTLLVIYIYLVIHPNEKLWTDKFPEHQYQNNW